MSWRNLQAWDLTSLFALTYWPSWLISPLVSPYTCCVASWRRQEKHSGMHWLIQNHFRHICQKPLGMTLNPCVLNVIMCSWKYLLLLSQLRTCFSRITNTIDLCTIPDTLIRHALKEYRLIQGLHSALSQKIPLLSRNTTVSVVRNHYYDICFNAGSSHPLRKIWLRCRIGNLNQKWRVMSLTLTPHITCC